MAEERNGELERFERKEIFSKSVRAGKRTYFFDVKTTKKNEFYLTITESKRKINEEGKIYYEKHKIFLYKEDFEKFSKGLKEVIEFINQQNNIEESVNIENEFTDIDFEDLEN